MNMYYTLVVSLSFIFLLFVHPHVCVKIASKNATGFSFKLIHRDSPESPLYPGRQLTFSEKLSRYSKATDARATYLSARAAPPNFTTNGEEPIIGRGLLNLDSLYYYMVDVKIGNPAVHLRLLFDTASDVTWTQCLPCDNCFPQKGAMYDSRRSTDFKLLPCDQCSDDYIFKCGPDNKCNYDMGYGGGSRTVGYAMQETLVFPGAKGSMIPHNLVIGCSTNNEGFRFEQDSSISGILGMSMSPHSFPKQLGAEGANVFSYCLPSVEHKPTYLRFGPDIIIDPATPMQSTPILGYKDINYYGLDLVDISISSTSINFPPGTFAQRPYGAGGCFIDTGAPMTIIDQPAFDRFITEYENAYLPHKLVRNRYDCPDHTTHCYYLSAGIGADQHPMVGFHFKNGAIYSMPPQNLLHFDKTYFALMIKPGDRTVIGAWQQRGVRILHDLRPEANDLSFAFEDCDKEQD